ncbi:MAG TPA: Stk1 family PASTA domain-containing Ser/Thr kinase [Lachnospiraceae bacterium]|nr:Stk1 family PASTA domain-containing Ser/Thr kinase [Lachnospiraceae bacterium]
MQIEKGTVINGRYRIIEKIGEGGMSIVYKAEDEMLEREVTFKVLRKDFIGDEDFISRFVTEARAAAKLSNTNIVNAYDVGNDGDIYYIVMEYIDGFTLKSLINSKAPFTDQEAAGIAIQIAIGLEHAHSHGIVHRDIKPENILITRTGNEGTVKVSDFGIAKAITQATGPMDYMGSVHYFSPEQAKGEKVDTRSDIYSLGIVLFEMVTGKLPFEGETAVALAMKHLKEPLPDIKQLNPNVSDAMIAIIKKATNKEVDKRYQSAREMEDDLNRAIGHSITEEVYSDISDEPGKKEGSETVIMSRKNVDSIKKKENRSKQDDSGYGAREVGVVALAVLLAAAIIAALSYFGPNLVEAVNNMRSSTVKVPEYVGMTYEESMVDAGNKGLVVERQERYAEGVAEGQVIEQSPASGERLSYGGKVILYVSSGTNSIEVPSFVGMTREDAEKLANESSLKLSTEYVHSDFPIHTVTSQNPGAGTTAMINSVVTIRVSEGENDEYVVIPLLEGKKKEDAVSILKELGMTADLIESYSINVAAGYVMEQGVEPERTALRGNPVQLVISKGPDPAENETESQPTTLTPVEDINVEVETEAPAVYEEVTQAPEEQPEVISEEYVDENPDYSGEGDGGEYQEVPVENENIEMIIQETVPPLE